MKVCSSDYFYCLTGCHSLVNYKLYQQHCQDDVCRAEDMELQCRSLGDYAMACAKLGVVLGNWRESVPDCGKYY